MNNLRTALKRLSAGVARRAARCRLFREESGNALIETALCVSFLGLPMLIGTVEMGGMTYLSVEISNAAHAGAAYGMISSTFAADSAGQTTAAQAEAPDFNTTLTVTPTVYYACSASIGGAQYSTQSAAQTGCSSSHALEFVQVVTSGTYRPPIHCPGLPATYTLTGVSVMEVEQ